MATKEAQIERLERELVEVQNSLAGIRRGGASGSARAGRSVSFMSVESLERSENRIILKLNRLRGVPEEFAFKEAS